MPARWVDICTHGLEHGPSLLPLPCGRVWMEGALTIARGLLFVYSGSVPWLMTLSWLFSCWVRCPLGDHCFHFSGFHFHLIFGKPSKLMLLVGEKPLREKLSTRTDAYQQQQRCPLLTWGRRCWWLLGGTQDVRSGEVSWNRGSHDSAGRGLAFYGGGCLHCPPLIHSS